MSGKPVKKLPDRLPPAPHPTPEEVAEIKSAGHKNVYLIKNPVGGHFVFRTPTLDEISRALRDAKGETAGSDALVQACAVWPDDARKRLLERSGILPALAADLSGLVGGSAAFQDILEDELSAEQAEVIVRCSDRAFPIRISFDAGASDVREFVFREPSKPELKALRASYMDLTTSKGLIENLAVHGDFAFLLEEYPFSLFPLGVRLLNLAGVAEGEVAKKL